MKIAVIGGGAIGLLVASYLSEYNFVHILTKTKEQAEKIKLEGIIRINNQQKTTLYMPAYSIGTLSEKKLQEYDVIFVAVKQYHIDSILPRLEKLQNYCVFLQNGLGHVEKITNLAKACIGIVEHGVLKLDVNSIEHTGMGKIIVGTFNNLELEKVIRLNTDNFPIQYSHNIEQIQIRKLIINAVINPLTAIYSVRNGQLIVDVKLKQQAKQLCYEVCQSLGIVSEGEQKKMWNKVVEICQLTANNYSSMYCDLKNKRPLELDSILGYIIKCQAEGKSISGQTSLVASLYENLRRREFEEK